MNMILAQAVSGAGGLSFWQVLEHVGLLAAIAVAITTLVVARRKFSRVAVMPQPLEVAGEMKFQPKGRRYSGGTCDAVHKEIDRRLEGHDGEISKIWFTVRDEDSKTRAMLETAVRDFDRSVGELNGTLSEVKKTNAMILVEMLKR